MQLRDYQIDLRQSLRDSFKTHRAVIMQLPTGAGKTAVAGAIAEGLHSRRRTMLALVHRHELVAQFCQTLDDVGLGHHYGLIAAGRAPTPWAPMQVASIQTLHRRPHLDLDPTYIVIDECHHAKAKTWESVLNRFPKAKLLGMTATPGRLDGKPLGDHFEKIVSGPSIAWLVAHGWLAPTTIKYVSRGILTRGVKRLAGDYNKKDLGEQLNSKVIAAPLRAFESYARDRRVIFFAVNRRDSKDVAELFRASGYKAQHIDGTTPEPARDRIMREFRDGAIQILCNVDIVSEGTDVPMCDCIMLGLPTLSLTRYLQHVGRGMRIEHGRDNLVLDLVGNFHRHGRPDIERHWDLHQRADDPREQDRVVLPRQKVCIFCATVYPANKPTCPTCGQEQPIDTPDHLDVDLIGDDVPGGRRQPATTMAAVRQELQRVIRAGGGRSAIHELRERFDMTERWETNAIEALNL